jgi:serine phosphatase RsbU (regulator of sigma subunit)
MTFKKHIVSLVFALFIMAGAMSQRNEIQGALNIRNFTNAEYNGHNQVFSITQDGRGIMYFGNKSGVLEYDGVSWRIIKVFNKKGDTREVNSLTTDKLGHVYVAAKEDLGVLLADKSGKMHFHSLKHHFPKMPDLKSPKKVLAGNAGVFYHYGGEVYQFVGDHFQTFRSVAGDEIYGLFQVNGKIFIARNKTGLYQLVNGKLKAAMNGPRYNSENKIYSILNFSNGTYIQTSEGQIDKYTSEGSIIPVKLSYFKQTYNAINVMDQYFSSGSFSDGLLIYDKAFNLSYQLDISNGLIDNNINCQFLDKEGNVWAGTNKGISKVDVISPVSRFGVNYGLISGVESICSFKGKVYFATLSGVYYLNEKFTKTSDRIVKLSGLNMDCYGVRTLSFGKDTVMLIAANNGIWMLKDLNAPLVLVSKCGPYNFVQSPLDPDQVFVANYDGLSKLRWTGNSFVDEGYIKGFSEDIFNISVEKDGTLWLGTIENGIIKTHVRKSGNRYVKEMLGNPEDGPEFIAMVDDIPYVGNDEGLFKIVNNKLIPSTEYRLTKKCGVHRLLKDGTGRLWAVLSLKNNKFEIGFFENDPRHTWNSKDFTRMNTEIMHGLYSDEKDYTWLGGPNGAMLFNPTIRKKYDLPFNNLIRKVAVGDSAIFLGSFRNKEGWAIVLQNGSQIPELNFTSKSISFEYAAGSYLDETKTEYSFKLEGQDEDWSSWSVKTEKSYTNLREGTYTFLVRARNIFGNVSDVASYKFVILPPWYRTTLAYLIYVILLFFAVFGIVKIGNRRILHQKVQLENLVQERTTEVREQKELVERQKELVEDKNRSIMDSIKYAKRLQDAILPTPEYITDCFREHFVFYRPKDIVSGDFYWVRKIDQKVYFSVVDCTGHGVPGAILSIVGNNGLNRAVREFGLKRPSEILDKLSELVVDAFKHEGSSDVTDGMDLALCCLDLDTNELEFSGANNPLYIISQGELREIKGNKQPVGPHTEKVPFVDHRIQLEKGDVVLLFSDGYADQFGGPDGKKFKYNRFKSLLIEQSSNSLIDAGRAVGAEFDFWKQWHDQVDDVCVLGVRI